MKFIYKAIRDNTISKGVFEASDKTGVVTYLRSRGYLPISIEISQSFQIAKYIPQLNKIAFTDIVNITRQLAIMLNAGLNLVDAFVILKKQAVKSSLLQMLSKVESDLMSGLPLSRSLKDYPEYFNNLYIALVKSGEASGKLNEILTDLADTLEEKRAFQSKVKGALVYPAFIVVAIVIVLFILMTFVIPQMINLFKEFNIDLPLSTQIVIFLSQTLQTLWPFIIIGMIVFVYLVQRYLKTRIGKSTFDKVLLRIPIVNNIIAQSSLVDATRTLAILTKAGVSILTTLDITKESSDNSVFAQAFDNVRQKIEKGMSFSESMEKEDVFPPILVQMAAVGEQTGSLDDTLLKISKYFEFESGQAIKAFTALIEPAVLIFLGITVGFLVMAIITPIYSLTTGIK